MSTLKLRTLLLSSISRLVERSNEVVSTFELVESPVEAMRALVGRCRKAGAPSQLVRPRELGGHGVFFRPKTTDWATLVTTFRKRYHLPPRPLPPKACILDLGANAGYTAAHFAHLYSDAQIIALEMDSANFRMAETNTRPWCSRVRLCHAAAWSVDGHVTYEPVGNEDAYHVDFGVQAKPGCQGREVDARGIDSILEECKIGFVDYVKMDVEGAEEEILLNRPGNWLRRVGSMKVEVHNGADMAPYMRSLESFGFHCRKDLDHWR